MIYINPRKLTYKPSASRIIQRFSGGDSRSDPSSAPTGLSNLETRELSLILGSAAYPIRVRITNVLVLMRSRSHITDANIPDR